VGFDAKKNEVNRPHDRVRICQNRRVQFDAGLISLFDDDGGRQVGAAAE
jgi:hypothetical protein